MTSGFDALVRSLEGGTLRRTVLRGLSGLTLGSILSLVGYEPEVAGGKEKNRKRRPNKSGRHRVNKRRSKKRAKKGSRRRFRTTSQNGRFGICHRTGSDRHPYQYIETSDRAVIAHHREHEGDLVGVNLENDPQNCGACAHRCTGADPCRVPVCQQRTCGEVPVQCEGGRVCDGGNCCPRIE